MPSPSFARLALVIGLVLPMFAASASEPAPPKEDEPISPYELEMAEFARFRKELRAALAAGDARAVLPLVSFPLRVNLGRDGSIALNDETAFLRHFDRYLSPTWRQAVLDGDESDDLFRSSIPLAHGKAWIRQLPTTPPIFKLWVVNTLGGDRDFAQPAIELACETTKGRYVVAREGDALELRTSPRNDMANVAIWPGGSDETGGTGECSARAWAFERDGRRIEIGEPGCREDEAPEYARASVIDSAEGPAESWCY